MTEETRPSRGRPRLYPEDMTPAQRTAALSAKKRKEGWTRVSIWLAPGIDGVTFKDKVDRQNKKIMKQRKRKDG